MPQWMPEDRTRFDDLCRRAEQQSREAARRAAPAAPPPPPAPVPARRPALDQETLLILVVLAFLLRCRADRELIWALLYILLF